MPFVDDNERITDILKQARTIAVVGLSDKPWRDSHTVARFMMDQGYRIIPVNPNVESVFGIPSLPRLDSISESIDIVSVFRRSEHVPGIVEAATRVKAATLWLQTGIVHKAAKKAADAGMNVVMDRCIRVAYSLLIR